MSTALSERAFFSKTVASPSRAAVLRRSSSAASWNMLGGGELLGGLSSIPPRLVSTRLATRAAPSLPDCWR